MIIESKFNKQVINFFNKDVEFDNKGCATVSDELGTQILENFPDMAWEKGKKAEKKVEVKKDDSDEIKMLKGEVERLEGVNIGLKSEIAQLKESEKAWRDECGKYIKFVEESGLKLPETTSTEKTDENVDEIVIPDGFEEVYKEMEAKNLADLKKMCKTDLAVEDSVLETFKGKDAKKALIKYVFENINK